MLKNWKKKLIAILLIFTMTFSNFALVGKTYATTVLDSIFSGKNSDAGETGSSNVEFDAYFKTSQDSKKVKTIKSDINSSDLFVGVTVKVKDSGYLKNAKILFGNGKELNFLINSETKIPIQQQEVIKMANEVEDNDLNTEKNDYETKSLIEENKDVQGFENNELYLVQLNSDSEMNIEFPISYEYRKYIQESMISKSNQIKFEGIYINEKAEEIKLSKIVDLKLSWEDNRPVNTLAEVTKYIGFTQNETNGVILQTSISIDNTTDKKSLPIKDSQVEIIVPDIDGVKPETVNIVAKSLMGTSGKENDEVVFDNDNWIYDKDNNKIIIKCENKTELISTQNENDILIDETAPVKEMYYSASGIDNYIITYTYKNVSINERSITTNIKSILNEFGDKKITSEKEFILDLKNEIGDIVTFTNETNTKSISKGYTYLNYNNELNKYEVEIDNKLIFNVSYNNIVEGLYYNDIDSKYISKDGIIYEQNDIYYKNLTLSKDNFINILGDDGIINIYNNEELLITINKDSKWNEEGLLKLDFEKTINNVKIETSKPINDGNLIFNTVKAFSSVNYEKEVYKNFDKITISSVGRAKYIYLEDLVDCGNTNIEIKLEDTYTKANLEIGQKSLSTLALNNNVEMKIELNNENINSDVYGDSKFRIKLPEYVESVEVTDYNIVYGEGLEIENVQGNIQDGNAFIDISIKGKQNALSSGIISKGTNIVLNTNIKVNLFAPAKEVNFELTYENNDVTNYEEDDKAFGVDIAKVEYSAPSGVVSVNSISGYSSDQNKYLTSVNQGKVEDEIAVFSDSKIVKEELTIMNNERNDISEIEILGRIPFKGVKDIISGDDLGTTLDTKMVSKIASENNIEFKVYYSENGEATKDLNDNKNGWTEELPIRNAKSFLIIPVNSEFKMESASKLRFTYEYEIPENLEHNEEIYGTFATYFKNNTDVATINDVSKADIVGLVTGEGPKFDVTITTNKEDFNEFEELEITTNVKNTGKMIANDILVTIPIPKYTKFVSANISKEETRWTSDDENVQFKLASLNIGDSAEFKITVKIEQFFSQVNKNDDIKVYSLITATDLDTILKTEEKVINVEHAKMRVYIENNIADGIMSKGNNAKILVRVQNLTNDVIHNAVATMKIADEFEYKNASILGFDSDGVSVIDVKDAEYNEATRTVTWEIGDINSLSVKSLKLNVEVGKIGDNLTKNEIFMSAKAKADETEEYFSGNIKFNIGKPLLVVTQTTSTDNSYVKEGDVINYKFNIKNEGSVPAQQVTLVDNIPEGLIVKSISYVSQGIEVKRAISEKDIVTVGASIPAGDSLIVDVSAVATSLNGLGERSVTNSARISANNIDEIESNNITHIVEASNNEVLSQVEQSTETASSFTDDTKSFSKTYKITGNAWLDKNKDGMREDDEQLMKGIVATLVDSDNGIIKQTTTTNSKGEYVFTGVRNGNYIVIFDYDTVRYTVTVYQKENVAQNVNSDVITTKIEQDGKLRNGAVTRVVTVEDGSVSNIDIGLIDALKFDLNLNMGISKITTKTDKGTETKTYDNNKLTKTEIAAKQVNGSSVYIEYTLTVKNEGEISGYAKKIVDYIPDGMEFNSGMNQEWYTGSDGNIYTSELANIELQPGETKSFKLVLSKQLTDDNLGTVSNTAEIAEDYNIYGISDLDSTPNNNAQNEDDFARSDSYLSVKTGEVFIYISVIITTIILIGIVVSITIIKIKSRFSIKGGV